MSTKTEVLIRDARPDELGPLGRLLVKVYAALPDFPSPAEQPAYYAALADVGRHRSTPGARVLVALTPRGELAGGVVYFGDMRHYGSGGIAATVENASGIRLLGVDPAFRMRGIGRALTLTCIGLARARGHAQVVLHTTRAMPVAWGHYLRLGFARSHDLDFSQHGLTVMGFRLELGPAETEPRSKFRLSEPAAHATGGHSCT